MASKVRGLAQINRAFKAAPKVVQEQLADVNKETAERIAAGARSRVPVRLGNLKNKIATTFSKRTGVAKVGIAAGRVVTAGKGGSALTKDGATAAQPSKYARLVEWGTSHSKASPFMGPSVRAEQQPHLDRIRKKRDTIEAGIKAAAGSGE